MSKHIKHWSEVTDVCGICYENTIQVVNKGCGHKVTCFGCSIRMVGKPCELCRAPTVRMADMLTGFNFGCSLERRERFANPDDEDNDDIVDYERTLRDYGRFDNVRHRVYSKMDRGSTKSIVRNNEKREMYGCPEFHARVKWMTEYD